VSKRKPRLLRFKELNPCDIAQQVRLMADRIESGDLPCDTMIFVADAGADIELYGWGKIDGMRCIGLLNLASHKFMRDTLDWMEIEQESGGAA
jgi:hypothetical protein